MLEKILEELDANGAKLVAVSKTRPVETILEYYQKGHVIFGENRVQELVEKAEQLPADIEWHFIGHLQTNKVKYIAPFVSLIHSVDSMKLLREINKQAARNERTIDCLLQMKIAREETKYGLNLQGAMDILGSEEIAGLRQIRIVGLMGMATFTSDTDQVRSEFRKLRACFNDLKNSYFPDQDQFRELSMGMSDDYRIALEEGSTIVRIGSLIFGPRH